MRNDSGGESKGFEDHFEEPDETTYTQQAKYIALWRNSDRGGTRIAIHSPYKLAVSALSQLQYLHERFQAPERSGNGLF